MQPGRSAAWTKERIEALTTPDIRQLRDNAQRLSETEVVALCDEIIKVRPKTGTGLPKTATGARAATTKRKAAA